MAGVIAKDFPDGFTVTDGEGAWLDPNSQDHDPPETFKIVLIMAKQSPGMAAKLTHVMDAYKTRYHQHSVGLVTRQVCAAVLVGDRRNVFWIRLFGLVPHRDRNGQRIEDECPGQRCPHGQLISSNTTPPSAKAATASNALASAAALDRRCRHAADHQN